uniref:Uncharacterized protein n=1 Tax=Zea mays TaxID=4577 RepID=C4J2I0_MAIZE|nr:unknown [Zea mays]ACR36835.1 unknown [Zea mays]
MKASKEKRLVLDGVPPASSSSESESESVASGSSNRTRTRRLGWTGAGSCCVRDFKRAAEGLRPNSDIFLALGFFARAFLRRTCCWFNGDISLLSLPTGRTPKLVAKIAKNYGGKLLKKNKKLWVQKK